MQDEGECKGGGREQRGTKLKGGGRITDEEESQNKLNWMSVSMTLKKAFFHSMF